MKKGSGWEDYVHHVYSTLLNLRGERIRVSKRTTFVVDSGETYEVDVYYEFSKAGVRHRVAIECKDWQRPVDQGQVLAFHQKIKNIGNDIVGVIVARRGLQDGAQKVAKRHGILVLTEEQIPSMFKLLAENIATLFIHEPDLVGEPFWCIAELGNAADGQSTGTYWAFPNEFPVNVPLFFSKRHAEAYRHALRDADRFQVYGLPQYKLRSLIAFGFMHSLTFGLVEGEPDEAGRYEVRPRSPRRVMEDFLLEELPAHLQSAVTRQSHQPSESHKLPDQPAEVSSSRTGAKSTVWWQFWRTGRSS